MYDSKQTLSNDISLPSGETHPTDKVLLSSGASGVNAHPIKNGWLEVNQAVEMVEYTGIIMNYHNFHN
jgi:hypothetical protein